MKLRPAVTVTAIATHVFLLYVYIHTIHVNFQPEINAGMYSKNKPVFDETQIFLVNQDTRGNSLTPLLSLLYNDYWGRPLSHFNSNKSWRPFTILTFRLFNQYMGDISLELEVFLNRCINVLLHVCNAELVSQIGMQVVSDVDDIVRNTVLRTLIKVLFGIHPVAVEVAANCANRPHEIGLFCSLMVILCISNAVKGKDSTSKTSKLSDQVWLYLVWAIGLCSSETIVFHIPAVYVTCVTIDWMNHQRQKSKKSKKFEDGTSDMFDFVKSSIKKHLLYFAVPLCLTMAYILGRFINGVDAINAGLFRKSQHPFHHLKGLSRVLNFSYVTSIHIMKACFVDPIGVAHEYGYDSVPELPIDRFDRMQMVIIVVLVAFIFTSYYSCRRGPSSILNATMVMCWMLTLFPISGVLVTGTFIAERLIYPSTVGVAILGGQVLTNILLPNSKMSNFDIHQFIFRSSLLILGFGILYNTVTNRISDWCDNERLNFTTLDRFPNNAKANESVVGYYVNNPSTRDVGKAIEHAERAIEILPEYCSVHLTLAKLLLSENRRLDFEEHILKAIPCADSHQEALAQYQTYWAKLMSYLQGTGNQHEYQAAGARYNHQLERIKKELKEAVKEWNSYLGPENQIDTSVLDL